jgi:hypothetical protein
MEHRQLVAQHQDLVLLRTTRSRQQPDEREQVPHGEVRERPEQAALPRPQQQDRSNLTRSPQPESRDEFTNPTRLTLVNVHTGATTVVSESLDQPTSVVRGGGSLWVSEGQTLRLVLGQPPNLPFTVRRLLVPKLPPGLSWAE